MTFYTLAKNVVHTVLKPIYRFEVIGVENFPKDGGVLLCANHIDNLDPPLVGITAPRDVNFLAKEELLHVPVLGTILKNCNIVPVKRGLSDREALRKGLAVLDEGKVLGIFPEGTRSKTGELMPGLAGVGFFALRSQSVVVPCAIIGPYKAFKKVKIIYGKPLHMTELKENKASAKEVTEVIMSEIKKLIDKHK